MKAILLLALVFSTAAAAAKGADCKAQCDAVRGPCATACQDSKNKKSAADCVKKMCGMAVQQCEASCGAGNAKKH